MEFGRVIKRATEVTWRHKVLWVFGIAAALFGGGIKSSPGGAGQGLQYTFNSQDIERWRGTMPRFPRIPGMPFGSWSLGDASALEQLLPVIVGILGILAVVALIVSILGIIVRYTSLGALIGLVDEVEEREDTRFRTGLRIGWSRFLRLFAIDLIIGIVLAFVVVLFVLLLIIGGLLVTGPIALFAGNGGSVAILGILVAVAIALGLVVMMALLGMALSAIVTLVREYAYRACVVEKLGVLESLGAGMRLMRTRFRESLLMWLLLLAIDIALGLVTVPLALLAGVGLVGPAIGIYSVTRSIGAAALAALPFLLVIAIASAVIGGVYLAWRSSVWTLTFRELRAQEALSIAE